MLRIHFPGLTKIVASNQHRVRRPRLGQPDFNEQSTKKKEGGHALITTTDSLYEHSNARTQREHMGEAKETTCPGGFGRELNMLKKATPGGAGEQTSSAA